MQGLLEAIAADPGSTLSARLDVLAEGVEKNNLILLEQGETYQEHSQSLAGVDGPARGSLEMVAGAFGYPLTVLLGISPAGMNATGESDLRNFYDGIAAEQRAIYAPVLKKLLSWVTGSEVAVDFPALLTPTASERFASLGSALSAYTALDGWGVFEPHQLVDSLQRLGVLDSDLEMPELQDVAQTLDVAPTQLAGVVTVDELRKTKGYGPWPIASEGALTVSEFAALIQSRKLARDEEIRRQHAPPVDTQS
jgi:hypothetical protein